jgi:hypothetical protein
MLLILWLFERDDILGRHRQPRIQTDFVRTTGDQAILLHKLKLELPQQPPPESKPKFLNSLQKPSVCSADLFDSVVEN